MAQRDYVRNKASKKNKSRIIPNLMMIVAVVLVILFIAILYIVSSNKVNKPVSTPQITTEKPQDTLPEKPEERWSYLKELENPDNDQPSGQNPTPSEQEKERQQILDSFANNTTVTSPTSPSIKTENQTPLKDTSQNSWLLQCGAFKDRANADALKAKLAILGISSFIKSEKFHRILTGPYASRQEAEKVITNLKNNGISSCIIMQK